MGSEDVYKRQVNNIVIAPANTGIDAISKKAVINQVHTKIGIFIRVIPGALILSIVAITLIAPNIEESPNKWIDKITNGIESPPCNDRGGYKVQPAAGPPLSKNKVLSIIVNAKGNIQKLQLFSLGKAMSGAPIIIGICQFARPTKAGITAPKIITKACIVVI